MLSAILLWWVSLPPVPESMVFCGMQTRIEPDARKALQAYIEKLYEHPPTLEALVARAETLLPYIEEALSYIGVPEDLKYLAIQESRLNPYAVSRSGAVGYWQFKDYSAREVGLIINDTIDERRHLFRSSAGAALYLLKQYNRHRNWLFAIIAYYEGGTGAIPYIDTTFVGKNEVCIRSTTHWYALRAIAHKLVFEGLIKRKIHALQPLPYTGPAQPVWVIAQNHGLNPDEFLALNPWLLKGVLPAGRPCTYYVPLPEPAPTLPQEPLKALFLPSTLAMAVPSVPAGFSYIEAKEEKGTAPSEALPSPPVAPVSSRQPVSKPLPPAAVAVLPLLKEPLLHQEWEYPPPAALSRSQARWNPFYTPGGPVLIVPPRKARIHIVQRGETPTEIAAHYHVPLERLLAYNRLPKADTSLPVGLRVHLREARPYDERPIQYRWP